MSSKIEGYLLAIKTDMVKARRARGSKVEAQLYEIVVKNMEENVANTIKALCEATGKRVQQIHSVVKKSTRLAKTKVNGFTIVVPLEESQTKDIEGYVEGVAKDEPKTRPVEEAEKQQEEENNDDVGSAEEDAQKDFNNDEDEFKAVEDDDDFGA